MFSAGTLVSTALTAAILEFTERQSGESPYATAIDGLYILRSDHPRPPSYRMARPAICLVAQGAKWASFGDEELAYHAGQALVVGIEAPTRGRVFEASPDKPCLVLVLELDLALMRSVAEEMSSPPIPADDMKRGVFVTDFDGPLSDCMLRILRLLDTPDAIALLFPMAERELCYWLLSGPHGREIARLALADSPSRHLLRAMQLLRERFAEPVRVEELAEVAQLSASAFHRQFKALTSLPPLQYQKQLRLLEARRLLLSQSMSVQAAAYEVGYESASQFSREYTRMFGVPPKRESDSVRTLRKVA